MSDFEIKLIRSVKLYPCLYDKSDIDFRNRQKKSKAWVSVASKCSLPVKHVELRWKRLRDRFVREHRKPRDDRTWELYNSMTYLLDHIVLRNSKVDEAVAEMELALKRNSFDNFSESSYETSTKSDNGTAGEIEEHSLSESKNETPQNDLHQAQSELVKVMGQLKNLLEKLSEEKSMPTTEQDSFYKYLESILNRVNEPKRWKIQFDILNFANTLVKKENETR